MKDLILQILKYVPQYLTDFGSVFSGPKRFIAQKNTVVGDTFSESLIFLSISIVLVVVMNAPFLPPGRDLWTHVGAIAVTFLLAVSLFAIALRFAWRVVGGRATVRSFFITYAYFFGVMVVIFTFFFLLAEGVFKVFEPNLYAQVIEAKLKKQPLPDLSGSSLPQVTLFILVAGYVLVGAWSFIAWGAYRELNGLSKARSFFAILITGVLSWPIGALVFFILRAMTP